MPDFLATSVAPQNTWDFKYIIQNTLGARRPRKLLIFFMVKLKKNTLAEVCDGKKNKNDFIVLHFLSCAVAFAKSSLMLLWFTIRNDARAIDNCAAAAAGQFVNFIITGLCAYNIVLSDNNKFDLKKKKKM